MKKQQLTHLLKIREASEQGKLVAFVGAGVSANSGVPTWGRLIDELKAEMDLNYECDDLKLAQLYKDARGYKEYMDKVKEVLMYNRVMPNVIHKDILDLNPCHIITTNYDDLIEQEVQNEFRQFTVIREDKDMPNMEYPNAIVKMHGDYETNNIVLCENDYYDYARNFPLIRSFVLSLFASKVVVFIGFSFEDLNLKIILKELQSVLQDNMQRVYLLSDREPDNLTLQYYQNKGINVVHLGDGEIKEILKGKEGDICKDIQLKDKGMYLHKILNCIRYANKDLDSDVITELYTKLVSIEDELRVVSSGIKYFLPDNNLASFTRYVIYIYTNNYRDNYSTNTVNQSDIDSLKNSKEIDYNKFLKLAFFNGINRINDTQIISKEERNSLIESMCPDSEDFLFSMEFDKLNERLRYLNKRELSCNCMDLEYPYILAKLGDYYSAYLLYDKISNQAWKNHKYIIYFICLYNIHTIHGHLLQQLLNDKKYDIESIDEKIRKIDLSSILNKLVIDESVRNLFQGMLTFKEISDNSVNIEEILYHIIYQRKSSEKGSASANDWIVELLFIHGQVYNFYHLNYILTINNKHYKSIQKNTIIGILNNHKIKDSPTSKIFNAKIYKLRVFDILIMIYYDDTFSLKNIFDQYEITSLELEDEALNEINNYLNRIAVLGNNLYLDKSLFYRYFENLIFIISHIKDERINKETLYQVILKYWIHLISIRKEESIINEIIENYKPDVETCIKIMNVIINTNYYTFHDEYSTPNLLYAINKLSSIIKDAGKTYDREDWDVVFNDKHAIEYYPVYMCLTQEKQKHYNCIIQKNINRPFFYFDFILSNQVPVCSVDKFEKMVGVSSLLTPTDNYYHYVYCFILGQLYDNDKYKNVKDTIDEVYEMDALKDERECLNFFKNPISYKNYDKVEPVWLMIILNKYERMFKDLIKNDVYKEKIKKYLDTEYLNKTYRNYLISFL